MEGSTVPMLRVQRNSKHAEATRRLLLLLDRRWFLARSTIGGILVFGLFAILIPAKYDSSVRLMPPDQGNSGAAVMASMLSRATDGIGIDASDLLGMKGSGALFIGIIRSRTVQDQLIAKFDLRRVYGKRRMSSTRKKLEQYTTVSDDMKSGIVTITVRDHDRERARAMAQAYVDELNGVVNLLSVSSARREREFLEQRLRVVKNELDEAAVNFSRFASENTAIDIPQQGKAMLEAAATLQGQMIAAQAELKGLQQMYGNDNSRVRAAQARVSELQSQLQKLGGTTDSVATLYPPIRKLPVLGVTYADLYRRIKIEEAVYETLTKQYELAKVQEAKEIPTVRVLDAPEYPDKVAFPPYIAMLLFGLGFGFVTGTAWVLVSTRWSRLEPDDPRRLLLPRMSQAWHEDIEAARELIHRRSAVPSEERASSGGNEVD